MPRRTIRAEDVGWGALSPDARETLRTFGLRLAFGQTTREIAEETGLSPDAVTDRMRLLRREIREQLGL